MFSMEEKLEIMFLNSGVHLNLYKQDLHSLTQRSLLT